MPEVITKYPDSLKYVLKSAGAKCGEGAKQQILTRCPRENFCALPSGEICIYTLAEIPKMTQITTSEIADYTGPVPTLYSGWNIFLLALACLLGIIFGMFLRKKR